MNYKLENLDNPNRIIETLNNISKLESIIIRLSFPKVGMETLLLKIHVKLSNTYIRE